MPGGLKPLPLPCGGSAETGWKAAQTSRVANDVAALRRTSPFALVKATTNVPAVYEYRGWDGVGLAYAPTASGVGGTCTLTWPTSYEDAYGIKRPIQIIGAKVTARLSSLRKTYFYDFGLDGSTAPNAITVKATMPNGAPAAVDFFLKVWCKPDEETTHETYGGDVDKKDSETEGEKPYAAVFLGMLENELKGSAFTQDRTGFVWCQNFADARFWAGIWRAADKLVNNSIPETADEALEDWVERYRVPAKPGATKSELRRLCAAHYRSVGGAKQQNLYEAFSELLGPMFVKIWYVGDDNDLDNPPPATYWPDINPGPTAYDLGHGTWMSERGHLIVEVQNHAEMPLVDFKHLVDAQLFAVGARLLPASMTFTWGENVEGGFELDVDDLDYGAMGSDE